MTDLTKVPGHLFTPTGKWKYEVLLDYTEIMDEDGKDPSGKRAWVDPNRAALQALRQATRFGTSGVSIEQPGDYHLVVTEPPNGYPIMVVGQWIKVLAEVFR